MEAIDNNQTRVVKYMLNHKVKLEPIPFAPSALHVAAYKNHYECIKLILQHKVKIDPLNDSRVRETPLHMAIRQCHFESYRLLLDFG